MNAEVGLEERPLRTRTHDHKTARRAKYVFWVMSVMYMKHVFVFCIKGTRRHSRVKIEAERYIRGGEGRRGERRGGGGESPDWTVFTTPLPGGRDESCFSCTCIIFLKGSSRFSEKEGQGREGEGGEWHDSREHARGQLSQTSHT